MNEYMATEKLDPQTFIDSYGLDAKVLVGEGMSISLGQALEAERLLCPAETNDRQDPVKRIGYLATMLGAAGSLRPEHLDLLSEPK
jgi:hypothetical protein